MTETNQMIPLNLAESRRLLRVCQVNAEGEDAIRLKRMGICVDRPVELIQTGDPMILLVVGARIGLSRQLAENVMVLTETDLTVDLQQGQTRRTA